MDEILKLNSELLKITENSEEWLSLKSEIGKADRKMDEEIYKLYNLSQEDIEKIEDFTKS